MDTIRALGSLALGSRLKRISELLFKEVEEIYLGTGLKFSSRFFAPVHLLESGGSLSVTELATELGLTHPAVVQLTREMTKAGLVKSAHDPKDGRKTIFSLTPKARELRARLEPIWREIRAALDAILSESGGDLMPALERFEERLLRDRLAPKVLERLGSGETSQKEPALKVVGWDPKLRADFEALNREWLEEYGFAVESVDRNYFDSPEETILKPGGAIFFALSDGKPLGTCALIRRDDGVLELAKMGVSKDARGKGIGRLLAETAIQHAQARGEERLMLETSSKLKAAQKLYEQLGFKRLKAKSHYNRADVVMEKSLR